MTFNSGDIELVAVDEASDKRRADCADDDETLRPRGKSGPGEVEEGTVVACYAAKVVGEVGGGALDAWRGLVCFFAYVREA